MAKKKVVVKKGTKVSSDVKNSDNQAAIKAMSPSRNPSSISAKSGGNPQARTVKVKANKQSTSKKPAANAQETAKKPASNPQATANMGGENPSLTANTTPMVGQLTATFAPNPNLSALGEVSVGEANDVAAPMAETYDTRIKAATPAVRPAPKETPKKKVKVLKRSTDAKRNISEKASEVEAGRGSQYVKES